MKTFIIACYVVTGVGYLVAGIYLWKAYKTNKKTKEILRRTENGRK